MLTDQGYVAIFGAVVGSVVGAVIAGFFAFILLRISLKAQFKQAEKQASERAMAAIGESIADRKLNVLERAEVLINRIVEVRRDLPPTHDDWETLSSEWHLMRGRLYQAFGERYPTFQLVKVVDKQLEHMKAYVTEANPRPSLDELYDRGKDTRRQTHPFLGTLRTEVVKELSGRPPPA